VAQHDVGHPLRATQRNLVTPAAHSTRWTDASGADDGFWGPLSLLRSQATTITARGEFAVTHSRVTTHEPIAKGLKTLQFGSKTPQLTQ
jgi:hypothetical protein